MRSMAVISHGVAAVAFVTATSAYAQSARLTPTQMRDDLAAFRSQVFERWRRCVASVSSRSRRV